MGNNARRYPQPGGAGALGAHRTKGERPPTDSAEGGPLQTDTGNRHKPLKRCKLDNFKTANLQFQNEIGRRTKRKFPNFKTRSLVFSEPLEGTGLGLFLTTLTSNSDTGRKTVQFQKRNLLISKREMYNFKTEFDNFNEVAPRPCGRRAARQPSAWGASSWWLGKPLGSAKLGGSHRHMKSTPCSLESRWR